MVWNIFLLSILPTWGNDPIFYFRLFSRILFGVLLVYFFECKPHRSTALPQPSRSAETAGASCFGELPVVESEPIASGLLRESTRKLSKFAKCQGKRGWSLNQPMIHACFFLLVSFSYQPKRMVTFHETSLPLRATMVKRRLPWSQSFDVSKLGRRQNPLRNLRNLVFF